MITCADSGGFFFSHAVFVSVVLGLFCTAAGVLKGFLENDLIDEKYDIVSGISAGSINAMVMTLFDVGDEANAVDFITEQWLTMTRKDIYRNWPGGVAQGFLFKSGVFDISPGIKYLNSLPLERAPKSGRKLAIGATNILSGEYTTFDENVEDLASAVIASSSVPGIFPVTEHSGNKYVDGGIIYMTPVTDAIVRCKDIADEVEVDIVLALGGKPETKDPRFLITPMVLFRTISIATNGVFWKDVRNAQVAYPDVALSVTFPSEPLPGWLLEFSAKNSAKMQEIGYKDGLATVPGDVAAALDRIEESMNLSAEAMAEFDEWESSLTEEEREMLIKEAMELLENDQ